MAVKIPPHIINGAKKAFQQGLTVGKRLSKKLWRRLLPLLERLGFVIVQGSKDGFQFARRKFSEREATIFPTNAQFLGTRERQEDALGCSDFFDRQFVAHGGVLAVVADGMGGMAYGREASHAAVLSFLEAYAKKRRNESVEDALVRSLETANDAVVRRSMVLQVPALIGTTLVAAVCFDRKLSWVSVGDSRIYLLREGKLSQLTEDHVYGVELDRQVEDQLIAPEEARDHPEREHLTSYLGEGRVHQVNRNLEPFALLQGDQVILCTDGVYRSLTPEEVEVFSETSPPDLAEGLISIIREKKISSQDNATIISLAFDSRRKVGRGLNLRPANFLLRPVFLFWLTAGGLMWLIWEYSHQTTPPIGREVTAPASK